MTIHRIEGLQSVGQVQRELEQVQVQVLEPLEREQAKRFNRLKCVL